MHLQSPSHLSLVTPLVDNELTSSIPPTIGNLGQLISLILSTSFQENMQPSLKLADTVFVSIAQPITNWHPASRNLWGTWASWNFLTSVSSQKSICGDSDLYSVCSLSPFLENNLLTSSIPLSFGRLTKMTWLDLRMSNLLRWIVIDSFTSSICCIESTNEYSYLYHFRPQQFVR